jgi:hypothetical protein
MPSYRAAGSGAVRSPPLRRKLFTLAAGVSAVVDADDGKVLATLPIGAGGDAGSFNPAIMEAFSSQRDGTLTVIKENGPADFAVEQTVQAKVGAKTSTLDAKTNRIFLITAEQQAAPAPAAEAQGGAGRGRGGRGQMVPDSFAILVVGKSASASPLPSPGCAPPEWPHPRGRPFSPQPIARHRRARAPRPPQRRVEPL